MKNVFLRFSWVEQVLLGIFTVFLFTSIGLALNIYSFIGDVIIQPKPFEKSIHFLDDIKKTIRNNYFVSISSPLWFDEIPYTKSSSLLQCGGVILNKDTVLTGKCVEREDEITTLSVRFNSNYWSIGGTVHNVKSFKKLDNFYVLKIKPPFDVSKMNNLTLFQQKLLYSMEFKINYKNWTNIIYKSWKPIDKIQGWNRFNKATEISFNLSQILHETCDTSINKKCQNFAVGSILLINEKVIFINVQPDCNLTQPDVPHLCGFQPIY